MSDWDPRVTKYNAQVTTNSEGKYQFNNIAAGEYFLLTWFYWDEPQYNTYGNVVGTKRFGGLLQKKVKIDGVTRYSYILTNNN